MNFVYRAIVAVFFICSSFAVSAMQLNDSLALQNMDHELNQQPWLTYQKIQSQADKLANATPVYKLWWLLRKAQAENLIYFFDEFEQTVTTAQTLINEKIPARIAINFTIFQGVISQRQGKHQKAQKLLKKAQQAAITHKYTDLAVNAKLALAYTRSLTELYEYSLTDLQQAYVEAFALDNDFLVAQINEVYGAIYGYLHDYGQSIEYYQKALTSYQQHTYPAHEAETLYGLATTYRYWQKYDLALDYYHRYQKSIEFSPNNVDGKFYALYGISMSLAGKGDCTQALGYIKEALNLSGLMHYKAELYKRQALCFIDKSKLNLATTALDNAATIFTNIPELKGTRWQIDVIKIRAELLQAKGDYAQAYRLLKQFNQRKIARLNNYSDKLLRVKGALEVERQNVEITLLQQRTKIDKLQLAQQKQDSLIQTYIISFIVMLIFFGLVFITFQWRHNQKLLALSIRDPLSDLYNSHYIFHFLNKLIDAINLEKNQVSIMLIAIDDFKQINDLYGHSFGDKVIREVAKIGEDTLRIEDIIGRVGGEEFLCVLPRIDSIQCLHIAQRLVKRVHEHALFIGDEEDNKQQVNVTVSIGISTTSVDTINSSDLYLQADKALYHAKANGKNRAVQYQKMMQHSYLQSN
ncbi:MAG: diguanylate cyclase [Colwellia sp.]|nr:diguanylate cyclase [Colwellia sp.]